MCVCVGLSASWQSARELFCVTRVAEFFSGKENSRQQYSGIA